MKGILAVILICAAVIAVLIGTLLLPNGWRQDSPLYPIIKLGSVECPMDYTDRIAVFPRPDLPFQKNITYWKPEIHYQTERDSKLFINGRYITNGTRISISPDIKSISMKFQSGKVTENWTLFFTTLPVIEIRADVIEWHKNFMGMMRIFTPGIQKTPEFIAVKQKMRGTSDRDPKRPMTISLFRRSDALLGMRDDDKWVLDALWADPSYIRNRLMFDLFRSMQGNNKSIENYAPDGRMVEFFLNHRYVGIFFLMEKIDRKLAGLEQNGLIYKSTDRYMCDFRSSGIVRPDMPPEAGFVIKYPKLHTEVDFEPLQDLVRFVARADQKEFDNKISVYFDMDNLIDHTLLLWAGAARDNLTHNYSLVKNPNGPFHILPWDNEVSFGCNNNKKRLPPKHHLEKKANRLQLLLLNSPRYRPLIVKRWKELRKGLFSTDSILKRIDKYYQQLIVSGAAKRDRKRWKPEYVPIEDEFKFLRSFIIKRMEFLDNQFLSTISDS